MRTNYLPQPVLMQEAIEALIAKLGISKASEFWASLGYGKKNYTEFRKEIFAKENINGLYKKIKESEK